MFSAGQSLIGGGGGGGGKGNNFDSALFDFYILGKMLKSINSIVNFEHLVINFTEGEGGSGQ